MKYLIIALVFMIGCATTPLTDEQAHNIIQKELGESPLARLRAEIYLNPNIPIEEMAKLVDPKAVARLNNNEAIVKWGDK
jgi:hypothetical protein